MAGKPTHRVVYKDGEGVTHRCASLFEHTFANGGSVLNFALEKETNPNGDYGPTMKFSEALAFAEAKNGYLNVYENKPKKVVEDDDWD